MSDLSARLDAWSRAELEKDQTHTIARQCAFAPPKPVGWSSDGKHPMSHDAPLTIAQYQQLLNCGVLRTDAEVNAADRGKAADLAGAGPLWQRRVTMSWPAFFALSLVAGFAAAFVRTWLS